MAERYRLDWEARGAEARAAVAAFEGCRGALLEILAECESGRELHAAGFPDDVRHAARLDEYDVVPVLREGRLEALGSR
jgi:2-phosphosulfolactate phosphatase